MSDAFYRSPILNSPYEYPARHWELDSAGRPTGQIIDVRRRVAFITAVPDAKRQRQQVQQTQQEKMVFDEGAGLSTREQEYDPTSIINEVRSAVDAWRKLPDPNTWGVTPTTARLLQHWRTHGFNNLRPFFCQVEAAEVAIWLTEVAPNFGKRGTRFLEHLKGAGEQANPGLSRLALKLATGAGKTTVMAMLIAWQTLNAIRSPGSKKFTRGFLVVTPGITIRDRLRVLQPNDPNSYYAERELVPKHMLGDLLQAKIVITNYHAFKLRETLEISKGNRRLLEGRRGEEIKTLETEGQMLARVMGELMGQKNIVALNDEAHHCYREKRDASDEGELKGDELKEAKRNKEAARVWINGLETVQRKLGLSRVFDLSATPFFLRGSGYAEGTLFPWTMSDFSLMDAIECGIVKLPRVPVADNVSPEAPKFRNLWEHIGKKMPKKGRGKGGALDPLRIPVELQAALDALYGHYAKAFKQWKKAGIAVPPCFVLVCNNTATSKLLYDYISGFHYENEDGSTQFNNGRLALFRNFDEAGSPLARPRTLLIDSEQLESGEALDKNFREAAAAEINTFRSEVRQRGDHKLAENLSDQDLLREVMNTVGKEGRLGGGIRCVVSVAMLTEGWDASTVTHILGVRAFGTQLLCEQVVGRALRRQSYEVNSAGLLETEYADVLGIPFNFTSKPFVAPPPPPVKVTHVHAVRPARDSRRIRFPHVVGYRVELPGERLRTPNFSHEATLTLTPELVGPAITRNEGILGEGVNLDLAHLQQWRAATVCFHITKRLVETKWREAGEAPKLHLFGGLLRITKHWFENYLECKGGTFPAQLMYLELADMACERITQGIVSELESENPVKAIVDPYNPEGSTNFVNFRTSKRCWRTSAAHCHTNFAPYDSDWEAEFCRVLESHPRVRAYVKNQGLGFEIPYRHGSQARRYIPDFIVHVDDGRGAENPLQLVVEVKGYRREDAKDKKGTMDAYWVPGVNQLKKYGRWAFAEFDSVFEMQADFDAKLQEEVEKLTARAAEEN